MRRGDMLINVFPKHQAEIEQVRSLVELECWLASEFFLVAP